VIAPCISGLHQTWPSDHSESARSSWQLARVEGARLGAEDLQQPGRLLDQQARVGPLAQGPIEQQDARRMVGPSRRLQPSRVWRRQQLTPQRGHRVVRRGSRAVFHVYLPLPRRAWPNALHQVAKATSATVAADLLEPALKFPIVEAPAAAPVVPELAFSSNTSGPGSDGPVQVLLDEPGHCQKATPALVPDARQHR